MNNNKNTNNAFFQSLKSYPAIIFFFIIFSLLAPMSVGQGFDLSMSLAILLGLVLLSLINSVFIAMKQEKIEKRKREKFQQDLYLLKEEVQSMIHQLEKLSLEIKLMVSEMNTLLLGIENLKLTCRIARLEFNNTSVDKDDSRIIDGVEFQRVPENDKKLPEKS